MIDPNIAGKELPAVRFPVDRSKLAELARSFGDDDPIWHDPIAARACGFEQVPMQPTTSVISDQWRSGGAMSLIEQIGADPARVLHGEVAWEFLVPLPMGAELTARQIVLGITSRAGRRGGTMTLIALMTEYVDTEGQVMVRRRDTLIETDS